MLSGTAEICAEEPNGRVFVFFVFMQECVLFRLIITRNEPSYIRSESKP